jgi:influenza virus NS1A-binding protein
VTIQNGRLCRLWNWLALMLVCPNTFSIDQLNPCWICIAVCDLAGKVYVIGGWNGQCGMKQCNIFDPVEGKWTEIEPLNYGKKDFVAMIIKLWITLFFYLGRYQAAVTTRLGKLYAVGGCDAWNCLNTVEVYDPATGMWDFLPPMNTARRGCGVTLYQSEFK